MNDSDIRNFGTPETVTYQNRFLVQDTDQSVTSPRYYGYINETGDYYIMRAINVSTGIDQFRFFRRTIDQRGNYPADWANRANLQYRYWDASY